jgi:small-conductance mechanosensitive channel
MNKDEKKKPGQYQKWWVATVLTIILGTSLILVTLEISRRKLIPFVSTQQRYIVSAEAALFGVFLIESLTGIVSRVFGRDNILQNGAHLRALVRIVGYTIALICVISILASNPSLAISIGAVTGVGLIFATQNIMSSVFAAILILLTRMVRVGEEITVSGTTGKVVDIRLTHTILIVGEDIIWVPNSLMVSNTVKRKKRLDGNHTTMHNF